MSSLKVTLAAAIIVAGIGSASFAQTYPSGQPSPPAATSTQPPATAAPPTAKEQAKAAKKAERQQKRTACADQAKQQGLKGPAMKDFRKSCMAK
jgi:hypothetical protein